MSRKLKAVEQTKNVPFKYLVDGSFQQAIQTLMNMDHSAPVSYKLLVAFEDANAQIKRYDSLRQELLLKYGKKDEAGQLMVTEDKTQYLLDDQVGFTKAWAELLDVEVPVKTIPLSSFEKINISPALLNPLVRTVLDPEL